MSKSLKYTCKRDKEKKVENVTLKYRNSNREWIERKREKEREKEREREGEGENRE